MEWLWLALLIVAVATGSSSHGTGQYETLLMDIDDTVPAVDCNRTLENMQVTIIIIIIIINMLSLLIFYLQH